MSDSKRVIGHLVTFDIMGPGRIEHPIACQVRPGDCPVLRAIVNGQYEHSGRGTFLATFNSDHTLRLSDPARIERAIHEIAPVLLDFVDQVGVTRARARPFLRGVLGSLDFLADINVEHTVDL